MIPEWTNSENEHVNATGKLEFAPDRGWSASLHTYLTECLVSVVRKTRLEIPIPDA